MLTPGPLHLLVAMSRGCALREVSARGGPWFVLARPGGDIERVHGRAVNKLVRLALVECTGGETFRVTPAGRNWIAANVDKHHRHSVEFRRSNGGSRQNGCTRDGITRDALADRSVAEAQDRVR